MLHFIRFPHIMLKHNSSIQKISIKIFLIKISLRTMASLLRLCCDTLDVQSVIYNKTGIKLSYNSEDTFDD